MFFSFTATSWSLGTSYYSAKSLSRSCLCQGVENHGDRSCNMASSNWAQLLPHVSSPPDQVEKQWWSAVPAWGGQLGGGRGHEWYTPGAQGLHDSHCFVTDTAVCSPFLAQTEGEEWRWQSALPLARGHVSSEGASRWWGNPPTQSYCGGDTSTAGDSRRCGNKPRTWR